MKIIFIDPTYKQIVTVDKEDYSEDYGEGYFDIRDFFNDLIAIENIVDNLYTSDVLRDKYDSWKVYIEKYSDLLYQGTFEQLIYDAPRYPDSDYS